MSEDNAIYLDNAATTRVAPEVFEAMAPYFREHYGNASAKYYSLGQTARQAVRRARVQLAELIGAQVPADEDHPGEIVFTGGATESNNWVLTHATHGPRKHLVIGGVEHHAVMEVAEHLETMHGVEVTRVPVDASGRVDPAAVAEAVRAETALVSVMLANNEVGTLQPVREIARIAHDHGALMHTDAVQAVGKILVNADELEVDLLSLSAHKFYGPKGVGALYIRRGTRLEPWMRGGGQENRRRAGTLNVPGIVGLGAAAALAATRMHAEAERQRELVERLWEGLSVIPQATRNGDPKKRLPNILNVRFAGVEGEAILMYLDMQGVQVASGSACATDSLEPSHVLLAMGVPQEEAHGSIRFSLGCETTAADIDRVLTVLPEQVQTLRAMSVTWKG